MMTHVLEAWIRESANPVVGCIRMNQEDTAWELYINGDRPQELLDDNPDIQNPDHLSAQDLYDRGGEFANLVDTYFERSQEVR